MGFPILARRHLYIESGPWYWTIPKNSESSTLSLGQTPPKQNQIVNTLNGLYYTLHHYSDVIMSAIESQITGLSIDCSVVCPGADQRKHQSSASLALVSRIHRWPVDSPHKGPVIGRTVPLLKPSQSPQSDNVILGRWTMRKISPHPWPHGKPGLIALFGPLRPYCSQSPLILLRCVTEIKFAQNLCWLGNWY